ncbi:MAG: secretin N-terminal domain-containing protein, partial [Gemmatimonas sp.]
KPWDIALQAILSGQGLAATEDASGILTVDSYRNLASNQSLEPLITRILDVNYAKASTLQNTVQKLLARDCTGMSTQATSRELGVNANQSQGGQSNNGMQGQGCVVRGSVAADSATNKLIITEVPSRLPEIIARLQELDIRTPQVLIKAKIVFVNRTGVTDLGLAYDLGKGTEQFFQQLVPRTDPSTTHAIDTNGDGVPDATGGGTAFEGPARIALGGKALSGIANAGNAIKPNALNLIYSAALGKYQLTTFLNALSTSSLADVQSEPSVTILNNRTATIFVGQEIPIRVIDASAGGSGGGGGGGGGGSQSQPNAAAFFPRATVTKEEAGIKLTVTPQITNNKMVLLDMIAENSSAELANTDIGVIFNRQKAQSQVLVADGEAAVIGGLTVTEKNKFRSGIPFLMNLPYIGRLFSQNSTTETKRDLLILVTPHIIEDGATPPGR